MWDDLKNTPPITPVPAEQPPGISRTLKSYQLEGLNWMLQQEKSQYKGGLLGDEMGMGKTIQAVSLLMSDYPVGKPSLVVVPPVALMQWQSEIKVRLFCVLKIIVTVLIFMTSGLHEWPVECSCVPQFQCQGQTPNKERT
jgi:DNA repair protein RAD16